MFFSPKKKVSIPFKRESVSEPRDTGRYVFDILHVSIPFKRESVSEHTIVVGGILIVLGVLVSIPFKRESVSERCLQSSHKYQRVKFQFPSNGKAYLN